MGPSAEVERDLAPGRCDAYVVDLDAGEALRFEVDQLGIDTRAGPFDPAGDDFPEIDGMTGTWGIDEGVVPAGVTGGYRLEVFRPGRTGTGTGYRLSVEVRPATEEARVAIGAQSSFRRGRDLQLAGGRESAARETLSDAVQLYRQAGLPRGEAWAQHALGGLHKSSGEPGAAERAYLRAVELYRQTGETYGVGRACLDLARVRRQLDDLAGARACLDEASSIAEEFGDQRLRRRIEAERGHVLEEEGRSGDALRTYSRVLQDGRSDLTRSELYDLQIALGTLYLDAGEPDAALASFTDALKAVDDSEPVRRAQVLQNLGRARRELGAWEEAIEDLEEARTLFEAEGEHQDVAETLNSLGLVYLERGEHEAAAALLFAGLARVHEHRLGSYEASVRVNLAIHSLAVGERENAHDHCLRAQAVARESGRPELQVSTGYCVARTLLELGRLAEATEATASYLERAESLRAEKAHAGHRAGYQARKRHLFELPVTLHLRLAEREGEGADRHADAAFAAAERARFRTLLEVLAAAGADPRSGLDAELRRELEAAEDEVGRLAAGLRREEDPAERARLDDELDRARARFLQLEEEGRRSDPAYAELTTPEPVPIEVVRGEVVDDETQLLVYFLGEQESRLWLIDRGGASIHQLPPAAAIQEAARHAVSHLARSDDQKSKRLAERYAATLAEQVLAPVAARLRGPRLAIVADGKLHAVPFGALPLPGADGIAGDDAPRLVEAFEIVYPASVSVLRAQRRIRGARAPAAGGIALLGDPVFTGEDERLGSARGAGAAPGASARRGGSGDAERICADLRRLPYSGAEAEAIAALAPEAELRIGFEASREWVLDHGLEEFGRLHFATHACLDPERPELSGIVLSMLDREGREVEGMLRAHEIYGLRLSADLAVISACSSALGREVRGEGLLGITRGFLYAGVPRVVVSLWDVDDEATAALMERFYRGLYERGEAPAAALTAAQREMARSERWPAPEYWAAFVLQGDWR